MSKNNSLKIWLGMTGIVMVLTLTNAAALALDDKAEVEVKIGTVLSLAIYAHDDHSAGINQVSLGTAVSDGDLVYNSLDLVVRTNVKNGYQLTLRDTDENAALSNTLDDGLILPLDAASKVADFPVNHWGYTVGEYTDNAEFYGIPVASDTPAVLASNNSLTPGDGETTVVTFATKIGGINAGRYEDAVVFTASPELTPAVPGPEAFFELENMQDMTSAICAAVETPSVSVTTSPEVILKDTRDNMTYRVRKLADGKCWMVQDLNYVLKTDKPLVPETSDVSTIWTPDNNTQMGAGKIWENPSANTARSYTYDYSNKVYYNWYAATGGTTNAETTSGDASGSVCPRGWTLPTKDEYINLIDTYRPGTVYRLRIAPLHFDFTGNYNASAGSYESGGRIGTYWSRTAYSADRSYNFFFDDDTRAIKPQNASSRGDGKAIRCVAK